MGKGKRVREARAGKREEMKAIAKKQVRRRKIKRVIGICVTSVVALCIVFAVVYNTIAATGYFIRNTVSMSSENYKIDNAMMSYYMKNQYYSFTNQYSQYLSMYGLDTEKTLKEQEYGEGTWFDYFMTQAKSQINDLLLYAEKAKADGITLDDTEKQSIEDSISNFKTYADNNKITLDQYLEAMFGKGVNETVVRRAVEFSTLASKYGTSYIDSLNYTDDDLQAYFDANKTKYVKADTLKYSFTATSSGTDEEKEASKAEAKANAEKLAACKTEAEFNKELESYLTELYTKQNATEETSEEAQQTAADTIKDNVESDMKAAATTTSYTEDETDTFGLWLFEDGRKVGDTYVIEPAADATTFTYTAHFVTKTTYFDEYPSINARHILFSTTKYETAEKAEEKANEILAQYNAAENKGADYFAELAAQNSDDANSSANGGLYEGITKDTNSYPESFIDWCYDSSRKQGDVAVITSESGAHLMYFDGTGNTAWKVMATTDKKNDDTATYLEELAKTYTVKSSDSKMKKIDM